MLTLGSGASGADSTDQYSRYCEQAQQIIANTDVKAKVIVHEDYDSFVKSKAGSDPLTVPMYASNPEVGESEQPRVLSCKMKPAERISFLSEQGSPLPGRRYTPEQACFLRYSSKRE